MVAAYIRHLPVLLQHNAPADNSNVRTAKGGTAPQYRRQSIEDDTMMTVPPYSMYSAVVQQYMVGTGQVAPKAAS